MLSPNFIISNKSSPYYSSSQNIHLTGKGLAHRDVVLCPSQGTLFHLRGPEFEVTASQRDRAMNLYSLATWVLQSSKACVFLVHSGLESRSGSIVAGQSSEET